MNLKAYFKRIDERLLSSRPILWVLGVHIFIPILIVVAITLFLIGFLTPVNPLMPWYTYESAFEKLSMTMILPAILLAIVFIVRQVKFNSVRVHVKLPYTYGKSFFLYYLACFWLITALPFAGNLGSFTRMSMRLDKQAYMQDKPILGDGFRHFYLEKYGLDDEEHYYYSNYTYELNQTGDSLILNRDFVTYSYRNGLDTISVSQALQEIQAFIDVSHKYQGGVTKKNPEEILKINLASDRTYPKGEYNHKRPLAFNHLVSYGAFDNNVTYHEKLTRRDSIYFIMELEFWKFYFFVPLGLSILLFVLCASRIADFGWGMLVVALLPTVFGITVGLAEYAGMDDEMAFFVFLLLFSAIVLYVAFGSRFKTRVKRAFEISAHLYLPLVVAVLMFVGEDLVDCCFVDNEHTYHICECVYFFTRDGFQNFVYGLSLVTAFASTFLYNGYYRKQYVHP